MSKVRVHTADDESPKCMRCDNLLDDNKCELCGPEHWWYYYKRTEVEKDEKFLNKEIEVEK